MAQITNTASATYGYGRASTDSVISNTTSTVINEDYAVSATKYSLVSEFRNGENIGYQIEVVNEGLETLANVTITDDLGGTGTPLEFVSGSSYLNIDGLNSQITPTSTNPLTFVISTLLAGETATITYIARVSSSLESSVASITNTASVSANEGTPSGTIIVANPDPTATITREDYAELVITKAVSVTEINVGEEFNFTLALENNGNLPANGIVVTDTLPEGFVVSSITLTQGGTTSTISTDDYTIDPTTNTLTLPSSTSSMQIIVQPAEIATITINGSIN